MKLDLYIFAKDAKGYYSFAKPDYCTDYIESYVDTYYSLGGSEEIQKKIIDVLGENDPKSYSKTYIMMSSPEIGCCALLRLAFIDDQQSRAFEAQGIALKDRGQRANWSLEGFCCPYSDREEFILYTPSLILWLENEPTSFMYRFLAEKSLSKTVTIPEKYLYNPLDHSASGYPACVSENDTAWLDLCNSILYSNYCFHFIYGPLARLFDNKVGDFYDIEKVFADTKEHEEYYDPYQQISVIQGKDVAHEYHRYNMYIKIGNIGEKDVPYSVKMELIDSINREGAVVYETMKLGTLNDRLSIAEIKLHAERIRTWAKNNGWEVSDEDEKEYSKRYSFEVEE